MLRRRDFLVSAAATCLGPGLAGAQGAWPQRSISLVVPFSAGGSADLVARMFAQHFQTKYGVSVVIENKGGAGGSIGSALVAKAPPDGYTLVLGTVSTHAINPALYAKLPFNAETDFEPISPIVRLPNLLVVNNKLPVKTVAELVAYLKANDGKVNYGSGGNGTSGHLSTVMFMKAIGVTMTHIPFRGTADEMAAMVGGHIDLAIDSMTTIWPLAKAGEVRALAVTTPQRVRDGSGPPDDRRNGPGLRGRRLAGPVRAGQDAATDRRRARSGGETNLSATGARDGAAERRRRTAAHVARRIRPLRASRAGQMGCGGEGGRHTN